MVGTREPSSLASLELLNTCRHRVKRLAVKLVDSPSSNATWTPGQQELSAVDIVKVAVKEYLGFRSQTSGDVSMLIHSFNGIYVLPSEIDENVELTLFLLASADKVASEQYDRAGKLLKMCTHLASNTGNPVQRVVYYYAQALQRRIDRKTGISSLAGQKVCRKSFLELEESAVIRQPTMLAERLALPFCLVLKSAGIQAIFDAMIFSRRIHVIDLGIGCGMQWPLLMQALKERVECPLESLTITAVVMSSEDMVKETGKRLTHFAETMGLPFSFKMVIVSDVNNLKEEMFELEAEETVGVYSAWTLRGFVRRPSQLETLIGVLKNLHPTVMVMIEREADTTSLGFVDLFIEGLLHFCALFDAVDACMGDSNAHRVPLEADYLWWGIQNIVAFDVEERSAWDMKIEGWRKLLYSFDIVEKKLSMSSLYQANFVGGNSDFKRFCSTSMDGECLIALWKGVPLFSLSAWEFLPDVTDLPS